MTSEGARLTNFIKTWESTYKPKCYKLASKYSIEDIRRFSALELKKIFHSKYKSKEIDLKSLIVTIILSLKKESHEYPSQIRGKIWYAVLKSVCHKIYGKEAADANEFSSNMMNQVYLYFSCLVQLGELKYSDLNIINSGLQEQLYFDGFRDVILFVEDDDTFHKIKGVCNLIGIKLLSGGGSADTSNIEVLINNCDLDVEYTLLTLTDFDRYGETIAESFITRCKVLGMKVKQTKRIGINRRQVSEEVFYENRFRIPISEKSKEKDLAWVEKNGEFGIELQALGQINVSRLKEIVADEVLKYCNEEILYDKLREVSFNISFNSAAENVKDKLLGELDNVIYKEAQKIQSTLIDDREHIAKGTLRGNVLNGIETEMSNRSIVIKIQNKLLEKIKNNEIDIKGLIGAAIEEELQ